MTRPGAAYLLALALALPSLGTMQKYAGTAVALLYVLAALAVVPIAVRYALPLLCRVTSERGAVLLALGTFAVLVVAFAILYPIADVDAGLDGSDRDEAANLGAGRLLDGDWPYEPLTYLGNPISNLPGALLLASPFVALGNSAYQNLLCLPLLYVGLARYLGSARVALFAVWTALLVSPIVLRELVTGGDLLANCIYVVLLTSLVLWTAGSRARGAWLGMLAAVALGVGLSSRANFLFVVPLLFSALVQNHGVRAAVRHVGLALAAFAAVTLPFYLYDRDGFTPTRTVNHLRQFEDVLPAAHVLVLAAAAVLTLVLALARMDARGDAMHGHAALVQGLLVASPVVLACIQARELDFTFLTAGFGLTVVFFALFAAFGALTRAGAPGLRRPSPMLRE